MLWGSRSIEEGRSLGGMILAMLILYGREGAQGHTEITSYSHKTPLTWVHDLQAGLSLIWLYSLCGCKARMFCRDLVCLRGCTYLQWHLSKLVFCLYSLVPGTWLPSLDPLWWVFSHALTTQTSESARLGAAVGSLIPWHPWDSWKAELPFPWAYEEFSSLHLGSSFYFLSNVIFLNAFSSDLHSNPLRLMTIFSFFNRSNLEIRGGT